ncbi:membrane protein UL45 [Testudinid alphaherpesvirus 3]|uniref:Membrane protein UL45 n=1 Tax=Testudinid alphaherpesvirus 3 TaxID=2560801 RepID=A0A0M3MXM9_9ALPH|nr:membrane protein UL45 [Testudinid alphaherpesvirus 3]AIU39258.1 membrane protein UL45 [Testudinid alphaherpesvirus 3]AIU39368.1 membrane protein UL45 [Testudinid alphaherpesvirus 3]AKI81644.1 membrane protein UL45 [Testudinid alphaherpesvirus 3]AKI81747.1 membrane protein UL45 [Testudinid alphaherpesvirus 3]
MDLRKFGLVALSIGFLLTGILAILLGLRVIVINPHDCVPRYDTACTAKQVGGEKLCSTLYDDPMRYSEAIRVCASGKRKLVSVKESDMAFSHLAQSQIQCYWLPAPEDGTCHAICNSDITSKPCDELLPFVCQGVRPPPVRHLNEV